MDKVQKIREEVVRLKSQLLRGACSSQIAMETRCKEEAYNEVLSFLDTLEVKEVDLEKEMENWIENNQDFAGFYNNVEFAKHFFELGIAVGNKAQKGEEVWI